MNMLQAVRSVLRKYADFTGNAARPEFWYARTLGLAGPYAAIHAKYAPDGKTIQMLVRMGTATVEYPVSMRRDAEALVHAP